MSLKGRKQSDEHIRKRSLALIGKKLSPEHAQKNRNHGFKKGDINAFAGKKHTEESKRIMSIKHRGKTGTMLGKHHTFEARKKISLFHKGRKLSQEHIEKMSGKNSYRYVDGRSKNKEWIIWSKNKRNRVLKRIKVETGSHTFGEWELLKKQYNYTCPCCSLTETTIKLTEDHIIPLSKGGSDLIENIQPLCGSCNSRKNSKIIKY